MSVDLKDIVSGVALLLSLYSLLVATRTKRDTLQLSYEQKRQELLLLVAQRKTELQSVLHRADELHRDCRLQPARIEGSEHALTAAVGEVASRLYRSSISKDVNAVGVRVKPRAFVTHQDLVELEVEIGQAKQYLHEARETVREAEEFLAKTRPKLSALTPPDA